ncbi:MAG: caspase family protein, partial [Cyanobacteria bacterium P01_G01_bin.49]
MAKVALLVGVSEYEPGLNPLPAAIKDVEALQQVLQNPDTGGFVPSDIVVLENPPRQRVEEAIEQLFSNRKKDDLVLFFFSGHGIKDDTGRLYLAARNTRKTERGDLVRSSAVPANFIHETMSRSRSKRQVVILDSCFSGAFAEGLLAKDDGTVNIREELGGEGRAILTSSSSTQYSFEQQDSELSLYTKYLIEGITTGQADQDEDEVVSIDELHQYAREKVREIQPAIQPEIYAIREGFKIKLTKVPPVEPTIKYRKTVAKYGKRGDLTIVSRHILDALRLNLQLSLEEAEAIETEVLEPYRQAFQQKLQQYEQAVKELLQKHQTINESNRQELQNFQQFLELRNEDTVPIEAKVTAKLKAYQENLQSYERIFRETLQQTYPLTEEKRQELQQVLQEMELTEADVNTIKIRVTEKIEVYHRHLAEYKELFLKAVGQEYPLSDAKRNELKSQRNNLGLTEIDVASIEAEITNEAESYQQKLQQYDQAFLEATKGKYYPTQATCQQLQQTWQTLGLNQIDVTTIENRITDQINQYQSNLRQYEETFNEAIKEQYPLSEANKQQLRERQHSLELTEEDVAEIEARLTTEIEEYLKKLEQYEQVLVSLLEYEDPIREESRQELRDLQKVLGLTNKEVNGIEEKVISQRNAIFPSDEDVENLESEIEIIQSIN